MDALKSLATRMAAQGLSAPIGPVADVVRRLVGLQAQDDWVAAYAVRPRTTVSTMDEQNLVRTWVMRGTLHLVTASDAGWLVDFFGPRFLARQRGRRHQLGLTDQLLTEALAVIGDLLPATRAEIAAAVRKRGLDLAPGQAEAYLVASAAMRGMLHRRGDVYLPMPQHGPTPADPLRELALRYLDGYGQAGPDDFAAWSGLTLTEARHALRDLEPPVRTDIPPPPSVRLLGHWDPWLLGYRDRAFTLDPAHAGMIQRGGGFLQPLILAEGRVVGTWTRERRDDQLIVSATSFAGPLPDLEPELAALGRFLGLHATLAH